MRLVRKKIYRAIPELDRFGDEQCRRFVRSANASWVRRSGRWFVVAVTGSVLLLLALAGVIRVEDIVDPMLLRLGAFGVVLNVVLICAAIGLALGTTLLLRDWLLRRRVRHLIARCGACPACHYSLLGIRVGENLTIVCPECGRATTVDPALDELAPDETGQPVYRPTVARDDAATVAARRARHRKFIKRAAIGVASFAVLMAAAYGAWWWSLVEQAKSAVAERRTRQTISGLREAMWRTGPERESTEEYCRFVELVRAVDHRVRQRDKMPEYCSPQGKFVGMTTDVLDPHLDVATFEKRSGVGSFEPTRKYVLDILRECREDGTFDNLREILHMRAPIRELETDWNEPFYALIISELGTARSMARVNGARMVLALHAGDRREYVEALEETLVAGQIVERQGLVIDTLVGIAMRSLVFNKINEHHALYPDEEWTRAVLEAVVRRSDAPGMWRALEVEKASVLDAVQWFFAHPEKVRQAQLGLGAPDMYIAASFPSGWCGGYEANKAALALRMDPWVAYLKQSPWTRAALPPSTATGYVLVDTMLPAMSKAMASELQITCERNLCVATLAADLHRMRYGRYPASVYEVLPLVSKPELLIDPNCGMWYQFGYVQEDGQAAPVFEVMAGNDDRPAQTRPPAPKPAPIPAPVREKKR